VACAAANAVLEVIEEEGLAERAGHLGKVIRERWEEIARDVPAVGEIRGVGAMVGVEMVKDRTSREPDAEFVSRLIGNAAQRGVVAVSCGVYKNVVRHLVPLVITDEELEEGLDVLADSASTALEKRGPRASEAAASPL
jgi:4-aminobutyrate aminotransferase/(S)-3-amino-2-methylpropionate transaminase